MSSSKWGQFSNKESRACESHILSISKWGHFQINCINTQFNTLSSHLVPWIYNLFVGWQESIKSDISLYEKLVVDIHIISDFNLKEKSVSHYKKKKKYKAHPFYLWNFLNFIEFNLLCRDIWDYICDKISRIFQTKFYTLSENLWKCIYLYLNR